MLPILRYIGLGFLGRYGILFTYLLPGCPPVGAKFTTGLDQRPDPLAKALLDPLLNALLDSLAQPPPEKSLLLHRTSLLYLLPPSHIRFQPAYDNSSFRLLSPGNAIIPAGAGWYGCCLSSAVAASLDHPDKPDNPPRTANRFSSPVLRRNPADLLFISCKIIPHAPFRHSIIAAGLVLQGKDQPIAIPCPIRLTDVFCYIK